MIIGCCLTAAAVGQSSAARQSSLQTPAATTDSSSGPESPDSPRAALRAYLVAARRGDYESAATYIQRPEGVVAPPSTLARQLKLVLDRYAWLNLDAVSGAPAGDSTDELAADVDEITTMQLPNGRIAHVRMRRVGGDTAGSVAMWRFSRATVTQISAWYATLANRWLIDRLPASLLRAGPFELLWWQWLAMAPLALLALLLGSAGARLARWTLSFTARSTRSRWDDVVLERLATPLSAACTLVAAAALVPLLALYAPAQTAVYRVIRVGFAAVFFWGLWRLIDVARQVLSQSRWAATLPASRSLVPLGARLAKVLVAALGVVLILSTLGYPVASLVAGLGIGGLAVALAAQKTVENLFGAFSIGIDQPFREGDFVKVDDFVGTVEAIGLRSTRFRTLDRTLVTLPNGRLADMRLESFSARDRLRLATVIGLVYETTPEQMRAVLAGFERVLREHPKIWPDAVVVRFSAFAASSLDIEVMAWFLTADWSEFQRIREQILLQFMDVVAAVGTGFAFPTTTVHLVPDSSGEAK